MNITEAPILSGTNEVAQYQHFQTARIKKMFNTKTSSILEPKKDFNNPQTILTRCMFSEVQQATY